MIRVPSTAFPSLALAIVLSTAARAGIGDPLVTYHLVYPGPETLCLLVVPDGSGPPMSGARTPWGGTADATIEVEFLDVGGQPLAGYPPEDLWLISADGGLSACPGGTIADGPTDAAGRTTFTLAPRAGGWSAAPTQLVVNGQVPTTRPGVDLAFNSPDLDGDLRVNLADVQLFAHDYWNGFHHRSDLAHDGTVNLADIVPLANAVGVACP